MTVSQYRTQFLNNCSEPNISRAFVFQWKRPCSPESAARIARAIEKCFVSHHGNIIGPSCKVWVRIRTAFRHCTPSLHTEKVQFLVPVKCPLFSEYSDIITSTVAEVETDHNFWNFQPRCTIELGAKNLWLTQTEIVERWSPILTKEQFLSHDTLKIFHH